MTLRQEVTSYRNSKGMDRGRPRNRPLRCAHSFGSVRDLKLFGLQGNTAGPVKEKVFIQVEKWGSKTEIQRKPPADLGMDARGPTGRCVRADLRWPTAGPRPAKSRGR